MKSIIQSLFNSRHLVSWVSSVVVAGCVLSSAQAEIQVHESLVQEKPEVAGEMQAVLKDKLVSFPLLSSDYDVDIAGDIATVTLQQTFLNPTDSVLNATYLFPLNHKAAIYAMEMQSGEEIITAKIMPKEKAKTGFEAAKKEGKSAAMLIQHRPNMFTQNMANLMPNSTTNITLSYTQSIPKIDDAYELVIPMIVGPRYEGTIKNRRNEPGIAIPESSDSAKISDETDATEKDVARNKNHKRDQIQQNGWFIDKVPAYPSVIGMTAPDSIEQERVKLQLRLKSSLSIGQVSSSTHALEIAGDEFEKEITLQQGKVIDNKDFVLRYSLGADTSIEAGLLSHYDERGGFMSLMVEPPKVPVEDSAMMKREIVFVLDTSGSMLGAPMDTSKVFMTEALRGLRETDYFRILRFSDSSSQFSELPVLATPRNIGQGLKFVNQLYASGGTQIDQAINTAFDIPQISDTLRIVVFLSDGYIGDDRRVIRTVNQRIGNARVYAFGIGDGVNRFLLDGMAAEGRGYSRFVETGENATEVAKSFAQSIKSPLLTDINIDWGDLAVTEQTPAKIPDLFIGGTTRVFARYKQGGQYNVTINGLVNGKKASMPISVTLADNVEQSPKGSKSSDKPTAESVDQNPIPLIWAREQIFQKNRDYTLSNEQDNQLKKQITQLGLDYSLQSRFTSFLAVSEKVVNKNAANNINAQVPLPQVSGVSSAAYPQLNLGGSSTPEPRGIIAFIMLAILAIIRFFRSAERRFTKTLVAETVAKMLAI